MSKHSYKAIIFINDDHIIHQKITKAVEDGSVLVIGTGTRALKWSEFSLNEDITQKVDHNTQFILYSHGLDKQQKASYVFTNDQDESAIYTSLDIIKKIFSHNFPFVQGGVILHIASCYAGLGAGNIMDELTKQTAEGNWLGSSIFLHGDDTPIRGYKSMAVIDALLDNNEQNRFQLLEKFYTATPGDMHSLYAPNFSGNKPLWLTTKCSEIKNVQQEITKTWKNHHAAIEQFASENKLDVTLSSECKITTFEYLQKSISGGAFINGLDFFPAYFGLVNGPSVRTPEDAKVEQFIEGAFSLIGEKIISKEEYDQLISIVFNWNFPKELSPGVTPPAVNYGVKFSSSHEALFSKGLNIASADCHGNSIFYHLLNKTSPSPLIKTLNMKNVSCDGLTVELESLFKHKHALEILKSVLPKLTAKIDLGFRKVFIIKQSLIDHLWNHKNAVEILELISPHINPDSELLFSDILYNKDTLKILEIILPRLSGPLRLDRDIVNMADYINYNNRPLNERKAVLKLLLKHNVISLDDDSETLNKMGIKKNTHKRLKELLESADDSLELSPQSGLPTKADKMEASTGEIGTFEYLKQSLLKGGAALYRKVFNTDASDDADTQAAKADVVTAFVSDMFALVGTEITKSQFEELMVTMFAQNAPQEKLTSAHKALFSKGLDIATAVYKNDLFFTEMFFHPDLKKFFTQILEIDGVICSDLMVKNTQGFSLFSYMKDHSDNVKILESLLPKLSTPLVIDSSCFEHLVYGKDFHEKFTELCFSKCKVLLNDGTIGFVLHSQHKQEALKLLVKCGILSTDESTWSFDQFFHNGCRWELEKLNLLGGNLSSDITISNDSKGEIEVLGLDLGDHH